MKLTAPIFLAALALLVPVIVAFLVRRRRRVVRVPSTMLWRVGLRSVVKNRRVRDVHRLLALLCCAAAVVALALAAARPSGSRNDAVVYVVDVSSSMHGAPIAEVRTWLRRDVAARGPGARVAIVLAASEPRTIVPPTRPGPEVDGAIDALSAELSGASIDESVALAEGIASGIHGRVVVLSDHPVDASISSRANKPEVHVVARQSPPDNVGITSLFTRTPPEAPDGDEREATLTIATSSERARRARVLVMLDGRVLADRRIELAPHGEATARIRVFGAGHLRARVTADDGVSDAIALDDEATLDELARRPPRVALVHRNDDGAAAYFLEKALRSAGVTQLENVWSDGEAPRGVDVAVVLANGPGRPRDVPAFVVGAAPVDGGPSPRRAEKTELHLRSLATEDPLLRGVSLDDLTTLRADVLTPPRGARTLVELDGGPVLVAGGSGASSWMWLGIDPEASDLVLRVAFPVLIGNALAHLAGSAQIVSAKVAPRSEVMLEASPVEASLARVGDPSWRLPASPAAALAALAALLLGFEAWLSFRKRYAT